MDDSQLHPLLRRANQLAGQGFAPMNADDRVAANEERDQNSGVLPWMTNAVGGVANGMTQVIETPYNIMNHAPQIMNAANLIPGVDVGHWGTLDEMGKEAGGPIGNLFASLGKDPLIDTVAAHYPHMGEVGGINNPNPEYPGSRRIAENVGVGVGTMGAGALENGAAGGLSGLISKYLGAPLVETPARAIASQVTGAMGAEGGHQIADHYDIKNPVGRFALETAGSIAPSGLFDMAESGVKRLLSAPDGGATVEAMDRLGMRPSIGLTGNQNAATMENAAAILPFFGSVAKNVQTGQVDDFGNALNDTASSLRPNGAVSKADDIMLGEQVHDIATTGAARKKADFSNRENAMMKAIGSDTPVDITNTRAAIAKMIPKADPEMQGALQHELDQLDQMVLKNKTVTQQPVTKTSSVLGADGQPIVTQGTKAVESVTPTNTVPYEQFRNWRTNVGRRTNQPSIGGGQMKQLYKGITSDLEGAADNAGVGDDFKNLMSEQANAHDETQLMGEGGDLAHLEPLANNQTERGKAFFQQAIGNPDRMQLLKRNATPEQWKQLAGDTLEHLGLAKDSAQGAAGDLISPNTFLTNWSKMDNRVKNMLFDDNAGTRQTLDDLAVVAEAMRKRGNSSNFSNTAGVGMSAGALAKAGGAIGAAGAGTGAGAAVAGLPGAAAGAGITYATVKALMSQTMARWAANQGIPLGEKMTTKAITGAAQAGNQTDIAPVRKKKQRPADDPGDHEFR